jgi:hypothetical protein
LDKVAWMVGHWDVAMTSFAGEESTTSTARADITFMNRGHALMERLHSDDVDGHELNTLAFLVYNPNLSMWGLGVADSWQENVSVYNGGFDGDVLVLRDALRVNGGMLLTYYRLSITKKSDATFETTLEISGDGDAWTRAIARTYTRRDSDDGMFTAGTGYGTPAPDVPAEARQFDFLVGEWTEQHDMKLANGTNPKFAANGTAVYMMNGYCVMEYNWSEADPNLPDAATTVVRIYNRNLRRWECLYCNNRFNGLLYFGGAREGDKIILHQFTNDASAVPISQWVFHDWTKDGYGWYGNTSRDRGATWTKTWIIEGTRKK